MFFHKYFSPQNHRGYPASRNREARETLALLRLLLKVSTDGNYLISSQGWVVHRFTIKYYPRKIAKAPKLQGFALLMELSWGQLVNCFMVAILEARRNICHGFNGTNAHIFNLLVKPTMRPCWINSTMGERYNLYENNIALSLSNCRNLRNYFLVFKSICQLKTPKLWTLIS